MKTFYVCIIISEYDMFIASSWYSELDNQNEYIVYIELTQQIFWEKKAAVTQIHEQSQVAPFDTPQ